MTAIRLPVSGNIDFWGPGPCSRVPAPWRFGIEFSSCDGPCAAAATPGRLWPTGSHDDSETESAPDGSAGEDNNSDEDDHVALENDPDAEQ